MIYIVPPGLGSTSYAVHTRACVHFRKICDCVAVGVPVVSRCRDHNFWRTCDCRLYSVSQSTFILVSRCPHDRCPGAAVSLWCEAPTLCGSLQARGPLRQVSLCQWAPLSIKSGSWDGRHLWQRWTRQMLLDLVLR